MQVTKIRKNMIGTISFTAKFTGMRKEQDFIVYPNPSADDIRIQSDNRCGKLTSAGTVSIGKGETMFQASFDRKKVNDVIENIEELKTAIRSTCGELVGGECFKVENSTAALI